ncbi:hypothetical protein TGVEG_439670 [Toxoplasma gondii VEG]|uniref:Uncharacterized protein n=1 Tax=Toxoplasma gondii (strain ATCC 50861 / VEG) TaxID=432359 RepID=V4Z858_TOXGV|nr:hypothetical protein TGVEG_439670 [Toxoplasma gondii VEG]
MFRKMLECGRDPCKEEACSQFCVLVGFFRELLRASRPARMRLCAHESVRVVEALLTPLPFSWLFLEMFSFENTATDVQLATPFVEFDRRRCGGVDLVSSFLRFSSVLGGRLHCRRKRRKTRGSVQAPFNKRCTGPAEHPQFW